ISATSGTFGTRLRISFKAIAASLSGTASRTTSQPARTISSICATVAATSAVSVLVMDCTTTGAPPPIWTFLTFTAFDFLIIRIVQRPTPKVQCQQLHLDVGLWTLDFRLLLWLRYLRRVAWAARKSFQDVISDYEDHEQ